MFWLFCDCFSSTSNKDHTVDQPLVPNRKGSLGHFSLTFTIYARCKIIMHGIFGVSPIVYM